MIKHNGMQNSVGEFVVMNTPIYMFRSDIAYCTLDYNLNKINKNN